MDDKTPLYTLNECLGFARTLVRSAATAKVGNDDIASIKERGLGIILGRSIYAKLYDKRQELHNYGDGKSSLIKAVLEALENEIMLNWLTIKNKVVLRKIYIHVKTKKLSEIAGGMNNFQSIILSVIDEYIRESRLKQEKKQNRQALVDDISMRFQQLRNKCAEIDSLIMLLKVKDDDITLLEDTKRKFQEINGNIDGSESTYSTCLSDDTDYSTLTNMRTKTQKLYQKLESIHKNVNTLISRQTAQSSFASPLGQPNLYGSPPSYSGAPAPTTGNPFFSPPGQQNSMSPSSHSGTSRHNNPFLQ